MFSYYKLSGTIDVRYLILLISTLSGSVFLLYWYFKSSNLTSDKIAEETVKSHSSPLNKPIILFLRPFSTDGKLPLVLNAIHETLSMISLLNLNTAGGFESQLKAALNNAYTLIRLDDGDIALSEYPFTYFRSIFSARIGRYVAGIDEDWKLIFQNLAQKSFAFIVVPPSSIDSPTGDEILYLTKNNLLHKTIFIMPGSGFKFNHTKTGKVSAPVLWRNLLDLIGERIKLPTYHKLGGLVLSVSGQFKIITGIGGKPWYSRTVINRIFQDAQINEPSWMDSIRLVRRLVWIIFPFSLIAIIISLNTFLEDLNKDIAIYLIFSFTILLASSDHIKYCHNFMLPKKQIYTLACTTLIAFFIGFPITDSILNYITSIGWLLPLNDPDHMGFTITFLTLLTIQSILVYSCAYAILSQREKVTLSLID